MHALNQAIRNIMVDVFNVYQGIKSNPKLDHHQIVLHRVCEKHDLYEDDVCPTWLSRVVAGVIYDVDNDEFDLE